MKNTYTIAQRNELVEANLYLIDEIIDKNRKIIRKNNLEIDDVYQQLAERLIIAVTEFIPESISLKHHILTQLRHEFLNCKSVYSKYGITEAPHDFPNKIVSLEDGFEQFAVA